MKKKIIAIITMSMILSMFAGCSAKKNTTTTDYKTPDDVEPSYITSESDLTDNCYYIVKNIKTKKGKETRYYPLYQPENTCAEDRETYAGFDASRIQWVNYTTDEGLIPTMNPGDSLIYKSTTYIPTAYSLEKFFDDGYTFGVSGLYADTSGNYRYDSENGSAVLTTSSGSGFAGLENAESVYFVSYKDADSEKQKPVKVSSKTVSPSGCVTGLELMKNYDCDIRTGTKKVPATLTCDTHYFSSAETYRFGSFDFVTEYIAKLNIPDYVSTGYYSIGGQEAYGGFFRYVADDSDYHNLKASDYNSTIYLYDEYGAVAGTTLGLAFDSETGFLVGNVSDDEYDGTVSTSLLYTYSEYVGSKNKDYSSFNTASAEENITTKTTLESVDGSSYNGTFVVTNISKETISNDKKLYEFTANEVNTHDTLSFRYYGDLGDHSVKPLLNGKYSVVFTAAKSGFDGYEVTYMELIEDNSSTGAETETEANTETNTENTTIE